MIALILMSLCYRGIRLHLNKFSSTYSSRALCKMCNRNKKIIEDRAKNDLWRSSNPAAGRLDTASVNTEQPHQFRDADGVNLR